MVFAVVEPDYFANRKLVVFFGGELVPIPLYYKDPQSEHGPDLQQLEDAFILFGQHLGTLYSPDTRDNIYTLSRCCTITISQMYFFPFTTSKDNLNQTD